MHRPEPSRIYRREYPTVFIAEISEKWLRPVSLHLQNDGEDSPLQVSHDGISTYAVDWQLRELGGIVRKSPPRMGLTGFWGPPPFLADLMQWAMDTRRSTCRCPILDGRADCKGDDEAEPNYLFLGPKGGHPRGYQPIQTVPRDALAEIYPLHLAQKWRKLVRVGSWSRIGMIGTLDLTAIAWSSLVCQLEEEVPFPTQNSSAPAEEGSH